jgi:segregation and condensation protein A
MRVCLASFSGNRAKQEQRLLHRTAMFEVKTEQFSGPLDKLLELIEGKKLEIAEVSLAAVTVEFLEYLKTLGEDAPPGILADFLVVAAQLVLIKSKALLPQLELTEEEERDIKDLEGRLALYRLFAARGGPASGHIAAFWNEQPVSFSKPLFAALKEGAFFYPPSGMGAEQLIAALSPLIAVLGALTHEKGRIKTAIITLEEKIKELVARLRETARHSFRNLSANRPRTEVVAMFLAILHLFKEKIVEVEQERQFGDIIINKNEALKNEVFTKEPQ